MHPFVDMRTLLSLCDSVMLLPPCSRFIRLICVLLSKIIKVWSGIVNHREPLTFSSRINLNINTVKEFETFHRLWNVDLKQSHNKVSLLCLCIIYFNVRLSQLINNHLLFFDGCVLLDDGMVD